MSHAAYPEIICRLLDYFLERDFMRVTGIDGVTGYSETRNRPSLNQVDNGSLILAVK